jgi:hypothetical protein
MMSGNGEFWVFSLVIARIEKREWGDLWENADRGSWSEIGGVRATILATSRLIDKKTSFLWSSTGTHREDEAVETTGIVALRAEEN